MTTKAKTMNAPLTKRLAALALSTAAAASMLLLPARPAQAKCLERHTGWQVGADGTLEYVTNVCATKSYFGSDSSLWFYLSTSNHDNQWIAAGEYDGSPGPPKARSTSGADAEKQAVLAQTPRERVKRNAAAAQLTDPLLKECATPLMAAHPDATNPAAADKWLPPVKQLTISLNIPRDDPRYNQVVGTLQAAVAISNDRLARTGTASLPLEVLLGDGSSNVSVYVNDKHRGRQVALARADAKDAQGHLTSGSVMLPATFFEKSQKTQLSALIHELRHLSGSDHELREVEDSAVLPWVSDDDDVKLSKIGEQCDYAAERQYRQVNPQLP